MTDLTKLLKEIEDSWKGEDGPGREDVTRLVKGLRYLINICKESGSEPDTWDLEFEELEQIIKGE